MAGHRRQKTLTLPRGVFVLRYDHAGNPQAPPCVSITCESGRNAAILHPDANSAVLSKPGTGIVIVAKQEGTVVLEIFSEFPNGSLEATLKCEPISQGVGIQGVDATSLQPARFDTSQQPDVSLQPANHQISVLGHVARIGDTVVAANEWLAGPLAPSRIEGLEIRWPNRPRDVALNYGVRLAGDRPDTFRTSETNAFTGSRGRAMPIVGAYFELSGPGVKSYRLHVESLFLSGTPLQLSGEKVRIGGPTGQEPLVGIRLRIESLKQSAIPESSNPSREGAPRHVRVFRAG